jgi:hypothetical protein
MMALLHPERHFDSPASIDRLAQKNNRGESGLVGNQVLIHRGLSHLASNLSRAGDVILPLRRGRTLAHATTLRLSWRRRAVASEPIATTHPAAAMADGSGTCASVAGAANKEDP